MKSDYPRFRAAYEPEDLAAHFLLTASDLELIAQCRGDVNRHGIAVLLKSLWYREVPREVRKYLAGQLNLLWDHTEHYPADEHTRRFHLTLIREQTGWRASTARDKEVLERWLREEGARSAHTEDDLMEVAYERLRDGKIELPAEKELRRSVNAASHGFFQDLYACVSGVVSLFLQKNTNSDTTPGSPGPARRSGDRSLYAAQGQAPARARIRRYGGDPEEVYTKFVYRANWFVPDQTEGEPAETPATPGWEKARALDTLGASRQRAR